MGTGGGVKALSYIACGYQQITSLSAATGLTIPVNATWALVECESQQVRWRDDGTSPTASVGMLMNVGDLLIYDAFKVTGSAPTSDLKFIEVTASAKLNVTYYS